MKKSSVKGIVFDLDGTLVDSLGFTIEAFNHGIVSQGGKRLSATELMRFFGPGEGDIFAAILGTSKAAAAYEAYRDYQERNVGKMPLHAGVVDLLEKLESGNHPVAIFTGRSWGTTEMILAHHGMLDRFVTVVASDHVSQPKPSPEGLYLALARMKLEPEQTLFVGDHAADMMAAKSAGAHGVGALWDPLAKRDALTPYSPRHWAETPAQVWDIFEEARK